MVLGEHPLQKKVMEKHHLSPKWVSRLPAKPMKMVDRVWCNLDKGAGKYGKGYMRAEKDITQEDWFFYCHFFGDPVMPGVIGLDGCYQTLAIAMLLQETPGVPRALSGSIQYTGQVLTSVKKTTYRVEIKRVIHNPNPMIISDIDYFRDDEATPIYKLRDARMGWYKEGELERSSFYRPDWEKIKKNALEDIEASHQYYLKYVGGDGF